MRDFDPNRNPYQILGVPSSATSQQIRDAYHRLALHYHPDRNPSPDALRKMQEVNWAYQILSNPSKRATYDALYASSRSSQYSSPQRTAYTPPPNPSPPRPPSSSSTNPPSYRPAQTGSGRKAGVSGFSIIFMIWLVFQAISTATRSSQPTYPYTSQDYYPVNYSLTLRAQAQEFASIALTMTSRPELIFPATLSTYSEKPIIMPTEINSGYWMDIFEQVKPGSPEWEWIDTLFEEYHLTTPDGLSDEVTRFERNVLTGVLLMETRQYGTFTIYLTSENTPVPVHISPAGVATETVAVPVDTPRPNNYQDITARVVPGSQEWEWIDQYFGSYGLTTPDGLSDEVTVVYYDQLSSMIRIETRSQGMLGIVIDKHSMSVFPVHISP